MGDRDIDRLIKETVEDSRWFPFRYDRRSDQIQFVWIPDEQHHALTFLAGLTPAVQQVRIIGRASVATAEIPQAPVHHILHSGLAGSTLLARALYQPGVVVTFKEPPIHTDVIAYGIYGASEGQVGQLNDHVTRLLARRRPGGEAVVFKMNSIGNSLVAAIARSRGDSQILCLHSPIERFLRSLAAKGSDGLLGGRKLFTGLQNSGLTKSILSAEASQFSDLQLAAAAWLAIHRLMHEAAAEFGPERVRSLNSEQLFSDPGGTLETIAAHFRLDLDVKARLASGVFTRHSKTGQPFDNAERKQQDAAVTAAHGREIGETADWARRVAEGANIPWDVPYPLLP